ncbi:DUF4625 domain-containing protein [Pararhodonellum marinum]|uniref:DUF4625 domain-containing protein n=1 Tax=Pararhodonellum marinum TaxID=2755358 RepID=UPI00188F4B58|nr:DUF4625 domain-containing protein [Pararhodonellum marinum]
MIKNLRLIAFAGLALNFACATDDDVPPVTDLNAPVIGFAENRDGIRPFEGEEMPRSKDHLHLRFSVTDDSGIGQVLVDIHSSFDGHSHGRVANDFEAMNVKDIYSPDASNVALRFPEGSTFLNVDNSTTDIYWEGPTSRVEGNVLAGPYDIIISATDIHGNQTQFADGSNYIATFYIDRPYAPMVSVTNLDGGELEGEAGEALDVQGMIEKTDHNLSSDIKFVWIRLMEEEGEHSHSGRLANGEFYEKMWGESTWQDLEGDPLPANTTSLDLSEILSGENAIILPDEDDHLDLVIWVEDMAGNITRKNYEVHIE